MKNKKKIIIDATGANTFGAKFHIKSLTNYFESQVNIQIKDVVLIVYTSSPFLKYDSSRIKVINLKYTSNIYIRILWTTLLLPFVSLYHNVNLIYSPFDIGPLVPTRAILILGLKNPNPILPKNLVTLKYPTLHRYVSFLSAFNANKYLFPSEYALKRMSSYFPKTINKGNFIYHGLDFTEWDLFQIHKSIPNKNNPYIFFCSILYKFKNVEDLFYTLKIINNQLDNNNKYKLIICGKFVDKNYQESIYNLIDKLDISDYVILYSTLPRDEIIKLYMQAEVIVIPTMFETFGHMYLEAIKSNKPVIVADTEIAREILSDSVLYYKIHDHNELSKIILNKLYLSDIYNRNIKSNIILKRFNIQKECTEIFNYFYNFIS